MVLHSVKFNKTKAAKKIGVDRKTLYNKTMKHKISKLPDKN
jgi:DNA-binding protein Fis